MFHLIIWCVHFYLPFLLHHQNDQQLNLFKAFDHIYDYDTLEDENERGQSANGSEDVL